MERNNAMLSIYLTLYCFVSFYNIAILFLNAYSHKKSSSELIVFFYGEGLYNEWFELKQKEDIFLITYAILETIIMIALILSPIFENISHALSSHVLFNSLGMAVIFVTVRLLVSTIVQFYLVFIIQRKYCFNRNEINVFIINQGKFIFVIIGAFCLIIMAFYSLTVYFIYKWIPIFLALIIIAFYIVSKDSFLFVRFFYDCEPLYGAKIRGEIIELVHQHGYELRDIYVINPIWRIHKDNVFCVGNKEQKDILIDGKFHHNDIVLKVLICRDLGHSVLNHNKKIHMYYFLWTIIIYMTLITIYINPWLYECFGINEMNYFMIFFVLYIVIRFIKVLLTPIYCHYSKTWEYEADVWTLMQGYGDELYNLLYNLSMNPYTDFYPHNLVLKLCYPVPSVIQRLLLLKYLIHQKDTEDNEDT